MRFAEAAKQAFSFLEKLADDTRTHAQSALAGDRMFFRRLETFRSAHPKPTCATWNFGACVPRLSRRGVTET